MNFMKKEKLIVILLSFCLALILMVMPFANSDSQAASYKPEGTMTWGMHFQFAREWLDPSLSESKTHPWVIYYAIHDALLKSTPKGPFTPSLAKSWSVSDDGLVYTFKIRKGLKFQKWDSLTSEDVKFSYDRFKGQCSKLIKSHIDRVEIVNPYLIRFHLKKPWNDFIEYYCGVGIAAPDWIVPKKYIERVGDAGFLQHPIGAGPYKFVKMKAGVELDLEAFDGYWKKVPHVKYLIFKAVTDHATALEMLKAGELDIAWQMQGNLGVEVRKDPKLTYVLSPSSGVIFLIFSKQWNPKSPWSKLKVRQAASLALDRKTIIDATITGAPMVGQIMPNNLLWCKKFPVDPYDPQKAKQLLAEAGYPHGFDGGTLYGDKAYSNIFDLIATYWRNIGIKVQVVDMERAAYYEKLNAHELQGVLFNATSAGGSAATRLVMTDRITAGYGHYPVYDALMKKEANMNNPEKRKAILYKAQDFLHDNAVFLPVMQNGLPAGIGPRVKKTMMGASPGCWFSAPLEDVELK